MSLMFVLPPDHTIRTNDDVVIYTSGKFLSLQREFNEYLYGTSRCSVRKYVTWSKDYIVVVDSIQ